MTQIVRSNSKMLFLKPCNCLSKFLWHAAKHRSISKEFPKGFKRSETRFLKGFTATSNPLENAFVGKMCFCMEGHILACTGTLVQCLFQPLSLSCMWPVFWHLLELGAILTLSRAFSLDVTAFTVRGVISIGPIKTADSGMENSLTLTGCFNSTSCTFLFFQRQTFAKCPVFLQKWHLALLAGHLSRACGYFRSTFCSSSRRSQLLNNSKPLSPDR